MQALARTAHGSDHNQESASNVDSSVEHDGVLGSLQRCTTEDAKKTLAVKSLKGLSVAQKQLDFYSMMQ